MKTYIVSSIEQKMNGYSFQAIHNKKGFVQIWTLTQDNKIIRSFLGDPREENHGVYPSRQEAMDKLIELQKSYFSYIEK